MSSGNSSSFSMPQNQEKKQIPRYEVRFTNKNHPFMWLVCKTRAKILLSDPETSLTTPRLLPLRRSRRSYGNYQSPQSFVSSQKIFWNDWGDRDDPDDHIEPQALKTVDMILTYDSDNKKATTTASWLIRAIYTRKNKTRLAYENWTIYTSMSYLRREQLV